MIWRLVFGSVCLLLANADLNNQELEPTVRIGQALWSGVPEDIKRCAMSRLRCTQGDRDSCDTFNAICTVNGTTDRIENPNPYRTDYTAGKEECNAIQEQCDKGYAYSCSQISRWGCSKYYNARPPPPVEVTTPVNRHYITPEPPVEQEPPLTINEINANVTWDIVEDFLVPTELEDGSNVTLHSLEEFEYVRDRTVEINQLIVTELLEKFGLLSNDTSGNFTLFNETIAATLNTSSLLFAGDIFLTVEQADQILASLANPSDAPDDEEPLHIRTKRKIEASSSRKWSANFVSYTYDSAASKHSPTVNAIETALDFWRTHTCLNFQDRSKNPNLTVLSDYIVFDKKPGCSSYQGRRGGAQAVHCGTGCEKFGVMAHEIAHALGFWHEQARPDRDDFVKILWENIVEDKWSNFYKCSMPDECITHDVPYDYGSVMHYGSDSFTSQFFQYSVYPKEANYLATIGGRLQGPTFYDVKIMNMHYCQNICSQNDSAACLNSGYPHPRNCTSCICPDPFEGTFCEKIKMTDVCGGIIEVTSEEQWGNFTSPNYPNEYPYGQNCTWLLQSPTDTRIQLRFAGDVFDFPGYSTPMCYSSYVELRTTADVANTGPKFCGDYHQQGQYLTDTNRAIVLMRNQDSSVRSKGFLIQFKAVKVTELCFPPIPTNQTILVYYVLERKPMPDVAHSIDYCMVACLDRPPCMAVEMYYDSISDNAGNFVNTTECRLLSRTCEQEPGLCKQSGQSSYWLNACYKPPKGCQLSTWTPWSACSKTCAIGHQTRSRFVLEQPEEGGAPCSSFLMKDMRPCEDQQCATNSTDPCKQSITCHFEGPCCCVWKYTGGTVDWHWAGAVQNASASLAQTDADTLGAKSRNFLEATGTDVNQTQRAVASATYYIPNGTHIKEKEIKFKYYMANENTILQLCLDSPNCSCDTADKRCLWFERNYYIKPGQSYISDTGPWFQWRPCVKTVVNGTWDCNRKRQAVVRLPRGLHTLYFVAFPLSVYVSVNLDAIDVRNVNKTELCENLPWIKDVDACFPTVQNKVITDVNTVVPLTPLDVWDDTPEKCQEFCHKNTDCKSFVFYPGGLNGEQSCTLFNTTCSATPEKCVTVQQNVEYWEKRCPPK